MKTQSFTNHVRIHPLYHYVVLPLSFFLTLAAGVNIALKPDLTSFILFTSVICLHLTAFLARDYAKKNQDRIIRAELRLRFFTLTGMPLDPMEDRFSISQLLAIRFAGDEEFLRLLKDPDTATMDNTTIKKAIRNWKPDNIRV